MNNNSWTQKLLLVPNNALLSWTVTTQSSSQGTITLSDGSTPPYFSATKNNYDTRLQVLCQGNKLYTGKQGQLTLSITIPGYSPKVNAPDVSVIQSTSGATVAYVYQYFVEDLTDNDYNDYCIIITAWISKG